MRWWWRALGAAAAILVPLSASAQNGTWTGSGEWTSGANWSSSPTAPTGTAVFTNNGASTSINIGSSATIDTMRFDSAAPFYSFSVASGATFTINNTIDNNSQFNPALNMASGATTIFGDASSSTIRALNGSGTVTIGPADSSTILFIDGSLTSTFSGMFNGAGTLELDQNTKLTLTGASSYGTIGADLILCSCDGNGMTISGGALAVNGSTKVFGGTLSIVNGARLNSHGDAEIDDSASRTASVSVDGVGSTWAIDGALKVGDGSLLGALSITNGGAVNVGGALTINSPGTLYLGTGGLSGSLTASSIVNDGAIVANFTDALTLSANISGAGTLSKSGSGTLTLTGADTVGGGTTVSGGRLAVNGTLTSNVTVNSGGNLGGSGTITGTVTNNGTLSPGDSIGTLTVSGSYIQAAGSTYQVELNGAGQSDRLNVAGAPGTATLNGGTVQILGSGSYAQRTTYTILNATGGVTGTFSNVSTNFAFLLPSLSYDADNVFLTLTRSFISGAQTSNQRAVAYILDAATSGASGDFATVLNALGGLDTVQGPAALTAMGGQAYANLGTVSTQAGAAFMNAVENQIGTTHGQAANPSSGARVALAQSCDVACDVAPPVYGAWFSGIGATGSAAGDSNASGYTYTLGGTAMGADYRFTPRFLAGVGLGFTTGTLWTNGFGGQGTADTFSGSLYGSFTEGPVYVDGLVGYANTDNRMSRSIVISGLSPRLAQGQTLVNQFLGQIESGYRFDFATSAPTSITPFVRLQGSTANQAGFTETGANSLNLTVGAQTTDSLRSTLGADFAAELEKVMVDVRLGWMHEYADTSRPMTASFAGAPGYAFTVYGVTPQRDNAVIGLSADTHITETARVYARYDGQIGGGSDNHAFTAGVRMVW